MDVLDLHIMRKREEGYETMSDPNFTFGATTKSGLAAGCAQMGAFPRGERFAENEVRARVQHGCRRPVMRRAGNPIQ